MIFLVKTSVFAKRMGKFPLKIKIMYRDWLIFETNIMSLLTSATS